MKFQGVRCGEGVLAYAAGCADVAVPHTGEPQASAMTEDEGEGTGEAPAATGGLDVDDGGEGPGAAQEGTAAAAVLGSGQAAQRLVIVEETFTETITVAPAATGGIAVEEAEEQQPRRKRRKLLTGMAVVWKHFGFASTDDMACEGTMADALVVPASKE